MITGLDHIVVLLRDLDAGIAAYQALFARAPAWRHSADGAATAIFTLDNVSLELMAPDGQGDTADRIRAAVDAQGEGLASMCFRTNDMAALHRRLDRLALSPEPVVDVERRDTASGASLSWQRTRTATEATRGVRLFFMALSGERPLSKTIDTAHITGLDHIVVSTNDPDRAAAIYGARLGLDMALDRSHPDWGRLMFFRCGDLVVEVVQRPNQQLPEGLDRLYGLSWRVSDIDATRGRLVDAGIDVSEARKGRKPGTRVMSVRSSTCGIPTLLVQPAPRRA